MTEISDSAVIWMPPDLRAVSNWRFFLSLFIAPLLIALLFFWLIVPVMAIPFGYAQYLLFFGPAAYWYLRRYPENLWALAFLGLATNAAWAGIATFVIATLPTGQQLFGPNDAEAFADLFLGFGSLFSIIWAATFALLYKYVIKGAIA